MNGECDGERGHWASEAVEEGGGEFGLFFFFAENEGWMAGKVRDPSQLKPASPSLVGGSDGVREGGGDGG